MCGEWQNSFQSFMEHIGPKPDPALSLDRIDVNGNYEPRNVRWADAHTQATNKRPRKRRRTPLERVQSWPIITVKGVKPI